MKFSQIYIEKRIECIEGEEDEEEEEGMLCSNKVLYVSCIIIDLYRILTGKMFVFFFSEKMKNTKNSFQFDIQQGRFGSFFFWMKNQCAKIDMLKHTK